jgi:hypothetical protein
VGGGGLTGGGSVVPSGTFSKRMASAIRLPLALLASFTVSVLPVTVNVPKSSQLAPPSVRSFGATCSLIALVARRVEPS